MTLSVEADTARTAARPHVLSLPSPATSRFLVLVTALLAAGLFIGDWVHNESPAGREWSRRVAMCQQAPVATSAPGDANALLDGQRAFQRCTADVESRRATYALGGLAVAVLGGLAVLFASPRVLERHRRLRPPGAALVAASDRVAALADETRVQRAPRVVVGSSALRDAFSYGFPGCYRIALPPALAVRSGDRRTFDPLVRHELAHIARGDVMMAWCARSAWRALLPLLVVPLLWGASQRDLDVLLAYTWRAVLLVAAALLTASAILRSREHEADLASSTSAEHRAALAELLSRITRPTPRGWRGLLAYHPGRDARTAVLAEPGRLTPVTFVDGLTVAFLAALIMPLLALSTTTRLPEWVVAGPAMLIGPLLGATLGLGLWRDALARRAAGNTRPGRIAPVALGVLLGSLLGEVASLAQTGTGTATGATHPWVGLVGAAAVCGVTAVIAAAVELFADAASRISARVSWLACVALSGALFTVALWASTTLAHAVDYAGWQFGRTVLVTLLGGSLPAALLVLLLMVAIAGVLLAARCGAPVPTWAIEDHGRADVPALEQRLCLGGTLIAGLAAGVAGSLAVVLSSTLAGPLTNDADRKIRFYTDVWIFAAASAAAALALLVIHGRRGLAAGLLAGPVASFTAAAGFIGYNTIRGGTLTVSFLENVLRSGLFLGVLLLLLLGTVSLIPVPSRPVRHAAMAVALVSVALAGTAAGGVLAVRDQLVGRASDAAASLDVLAYRLSYAPQVERTLVVMQRSIDDIDADKTLTGADRANRVRDDLLMPVLMLGQYATLVSPTATDLRAAHTHLLAALQDAARGFEDLAAVYERNEGAALTRAKTELTQARLELGQWRAALEGVGKRN
jgi:hypothetical protein